jgi:hypothetical protein
MAESDSTTGVEYRPIPGHPGYYATSDGRIFSTCIPGSRHRKQAPLSKARVMQGRYDRLGYHRVALSHRGKYKYHFVHRLVLLAFCGPCPANHECRHLDGDPSNNAIDNLAWGTPSENTADTWRHGRTPWGTRAWNAKLTDETVRAIRAAYGSDTEANLARRFGIAQSTLHGVATRKRWRHVV